MANSAHAGPIPIVEQSLINNGRAASPPGASSPFPRLGTSGDSVENRGSNKCAIKPSLPLSLHRPPPSSRQAGMARPNANTVHHARRPHSPRRAEPHAPTILSLCQDNDGAAKRSATQLHRQPTRREPVPGLFHPRQQGSGQTDETDLNLTRLSPLPTPHLLCPPARAEAFASLNFSTDEASCDSTPEPNRNHAESSALAAMSSSCLPTMHMQQ